MTTPNSGQSDAPTPGRDISSLPVGVGEYPAYLLEFFNWGAFSQPFLWGIVYGIWPIVLAVFAADIAPYAVIYAFGNSSANLVHVFFYVVIAQLFASTVARIYAGWRANELMWRRETLLVKTMREGKPRWDMGHYLRRQQLWKRIGMGFFIASSVASSYMYYTLLELDGVGGTPLLFAIIFPLVWLGATLLIGRLFAESAPVHMGGFSLLSELDVSGDMLQMQMQRQTDAFERIEHVTLNNKSNIPALGFGTYKITDPDEARRSVAHALEVGYRLIDTASFYQNEEAVGRAIKESGLPREEVFITSKLWQDEQGYAATVLACEETLARLGVDYLDLYLIHWPVKSKLSSTWKALEHLMIAGKIRNIGVCNFEIEHLEELFKTAKITPMVNQIELHPEFARFDIVSYCQQKNIAVEGWAPLARGGVFENQTLIEIGIAHHKTAGQVALRWAFQRGVIALPKSTHDERIEENFAIFDFELSDEEMERIGALDAGKRLGPDPKTFSWEWPKSSRN